MTTQKSVFGVSDKVRHKPGYTATENDLRLEISYSGSTVKGLYYLCCENKDADQLHLYCAADLQFCFPICNKQVFW